MALLSHGRDINFIIKKVKFWIRNYAKYSITKSRLYYVVYRNENHTSKISPKQNKNKQNTWHLLQPSPTHPRTHTRTHAAHSTAPLASAGPDSPPRSDRLFSRLPPNAQGRPRRGVAAAAAARAGEAVGRGAGAARRHPLAPLLLRWPRPRPRPLLLRTPGACARLLLPSLACEQQQHSFPL